VAGLLEKAVISPVLVGRADQLAALGRRLQLACAGQGQVVLISGEAGVGKTRLADETKVQAVRLGFSVLQGNCFELDQNLPYGPLVDLLRRFLAQQPEESIARALGPQAHELAVILPEVVFLPSSDAQTSPISDRYRLFRAVDQVFFGLAAQTPLLVVVEDVHWSDDASLDFLLHLAQRLPARPLVLLLTYRSEDEGSSLARFLLALNRARLSNELALAPLTPAETDALQRAIFELQRPVSTEFVQAIFELTEGNPFFIEEVLKSLLTAGDIFWRDGVWDRKPLRQIRIPRSVQVAVEQRAARLEDGCRKVMLLAAVAGRQFDFDLLKALTGMEEAALLGHLKQLVAAQIIVEETAEQYAFRHALTREAVYSTLLQRERQQYHRAIAEILERRFQDRPDLHAAELAHHYYLAGDWAKVTAFAQRAGDRAQAMFAPREATELYTRAIEAAEHLGWPPGQLHLNWRRPTQ
jgi:predicted ATPase